MTDRQRPEERPCGEVLYGCHPAHEYMLGEAIRRCPGGSYYPNAPFIVAPESRPYEVRTVTGERFLAEADEVKHDFGWVTFHTGGVLTLSVRATDVRTVRQVDPEEVERAADAPDPRDAALARVRELPESPQAVDALTSDPDGYARGYRDAIREAKRAARTEQEGGPA